MDGLTKAMADFMKPYEKLGEKVDVAAKLVIDETATVLYDGVKGGVPDGETGGLAKSLHKTKNTSRGKNYHGYNISFEGENEQGVPYAKIANILNYGRPAQTSKTGRKVGATAPTFFVTDQTKQLKGLSKRINQAIDKVIEEIEK